MERVNVKIKWHSSAQDITLEQSVDCRESAVWKLIGSCLLECKYALPNRMEVETDKGNAVLDLGIRGTYKEGGVEYPSMYVKVENNIDLPSDSYEPAYLTCVHVESNNYKFYKLEPDNDNHTLGASWGRIGTDIVSHLQTPYAPYLYWVRYYEKISKGYKDQTRVYLPKSVKSEKEEKKEGTTKNRGLRASSGLRITGVDRELYELLYSYSLNYARQELMNIKVTEAQVKEARRIFNEMVQRKTVKGFNNQLLRLIQVSPRREGHVMASQATKVAALLANSENDFGHIINREDALIMSMEALLMHDGKGRITSFAEMGVEVYEATAEQKEQVLGRLSERLKSMVSRVYRVIPRGQQSRFDDYIKKNNIKTVKQLWHGSRNCNWLSIIDNGLMLNPAAQITGKMFGNGIYFAPSSEKSWNYTSYRGTYWAKGADNLGIMGLYATAYGKPQDVSCAGSWSQSRLDGLGKNCVHAHAGSQLRNDEIIYYNESAMVLNYIVIFR